MSYNQKVITSSLLVIVVVAFGAVRYYQKTHPKYVPPPPREEVEITIIPGWNLRQVAEYLVSKGVATSTQAVFKVTGEPAMVYTGKTGKSINFKRPIKVVKGTQQEYFSLEGYLAPETFRAYSDATAEEVIDRFFAKRRKEIADLWPSFTTSTYSVHEILTMASLIEREVKYDADRAKVADILWRRLKVGWALQADSTVHYVTGRTGDVFTTAAERSVNSPWNTYRYSGLPPGPISNPSLESIKAALYPEKNNYWYFLSGRDGKMYYGKTLEEHNRNKKHL